MAPAPSPAPEFLRTPPARELTDWRHGSSGDLRSMAQALAILVVSCATAASQEQGGLLAQSLILAASPFVHREGWQPSALAQRLLLSSRKALHKEQEDIGISGEVRETEAASEGRQTARRGKSLYSPGPAAIRYGGARFNLTWHACSCKRAAIL